MEMWQQILLGGLAVVLVLWLGPGVKRMVEESPRGSRDDWIAVLKPLTAVVVFIVLLVLLLRA